MHCIFMDYISQILIVIPGRNKKSMESDEAIPLKISNAYREKSANCCQFSIIKDGWITYDFFFWRLLCCKRLNLLFTTWQQIVMLYILYLNPPSKLKIHNMTRSELADILFILVLIYIYTVYRQNCRFPVWEKISLDGEKGISPIPSFEDRKARVHLYIKYLVYLLFTENNYLFGNFIYYL